MFWVEIAYILSCLTLIQFFLMCDFVDLRVFFFQEYACWIKVKIDSWIEWENSNNNKKPIRSSVLQIASKAFESDIHIQAIF